MTKIIVKQIEEQPISKIQVFNDIAYGSYFKDSSKPTIEERINLVSKWQDIKPLEVEKMHIKTINELVHHILIIVSSYKSKPPRERISNLTHRTDYLSFSAGHWKHIETIDFNSKPSYFMALFYIEEGLNYGHEKKVGRHIEVVNTVKDRANVITNNSNLSELIDLLSFFLNISQLLKSNSVLNLKRKQARKKRM